MTLSPRQDDIVVVHMTGDYASCLNIPLKTEFITMLQKKVKERTNSNLKILFSDTLVPVPLLAVSGIVLLQDRVCDQERKDRGGQEEDELHGGDGGQHGGQDLRPHHQGRHDFHRAGVA